MRLLFITRANYQQKDTVQFRQQLEAELGEFALLPEGGSNPLAVQRRAIKQTLTRTDQ